MYAVSRSGRWFELRVELDFESGYARGSAGCWLKTVATEVARSQLLMARCAKKGRRGDCGAPSARGGGRELLRVVEHQL